MFQMKTILKKYIYMFYRMINLPSCIFNRICIGKNFRINGLVYWKNNERKPNSIRIGNNVKINSSLRSDPIGGQVKTILYTLGNGIIEIKNGVGLSNTVIVSSKKVVINEDSNIGGGTKIYDTDFHSLKPEERLAGDVNVKSAPVMIGKRVFIGGHTIILKGVTIGDDAVIGAGSVVASDVPSGEIWAGNPSRKIGDNK